jgi:CHRD domain
MNGRMKAAVAAALVVGATAAGTLAFADGPNSIRERLSGYEEDPLVLSTTGSGDFRAHIRTNKDQRISYKLSYAGLEGAITQAHIHFGGRAQSGGIIAWLCGNPSPAIVPPPGTQTCPAQPATISGTIRPPDVVGPAGQGIAPGEFAELVNAIRADVTYVNVHTDKYPGGEIRAQLEQRRKG